MRIHVNNLRVEATHGYKEDEKQRAQSFLLNITLQTNIETEVFEKSDELESTVDYGKVRKIALEVMAGPTCNLLETLAVRIANKILEDERVDMVWVAIEKSSRWPDGTPSVMVSRMRKNPEPWRAPFRI